MLFNQKVKPCPQKSAIAFTSFKVFWKSVEREEIVEQKTTIMVIHFDN